VDVNEDVLRDLRTAWTWRTIAGTLPHPTLLENAGAAERTSSSRSLEHEVNMMACEVAFTLFRHSDQDWRASRGRLHQPRGAVRREGLSVDVFINPSSW